MSRSALFWPADRTPRSSAFDAVRPDVIILDLEDGCDAGSRPIAREMLQGTWHALAASVSKVVVRINGADTDDHMLDIAALRTLPPDTAVLLPKPVSPEALAQLANGFRDLWCMGEEVGLIDRIGAIAADVPALSTVVIGIKDLAADLHIPLDPDAPPLREGANALRTAAQAAGLLVFDGMAFGEDPVLARRCARAVTEGFEGITFGRLRDCVAAQASPGQAASSLHSTPKQEQDHGEYRLD